MPPNQSPASNLVVDTPHGKCPTCDVPLFIWEGITALTLLTRTGLSITDYEPRPPLHQPTRLLHYNPNNRDLNSIAATLLFYLTPPPPPPPPTQSFFYENDCLNLNNLIHNTFQSTLPLPPPSPYADGSIDIIAVADHVIHSFSPKCIWLKASTRTGQLCWNILVTVKVRRYVAEMEAKSDKMRTRNGGIRGHGTIFAGISKSEGWTAFLEEIEGLKMEIGEACRARA